jgi:hypothetical protein
MFKSPAGLAHQSEVKHLGLWTQIQLHHLHIPFVIIDTSDNINSKSGHENPKMFMNKHLFLPASEQPTLKKKHDAHYRMIWTEILPSKLVTAATPV